MLWGHPSLQDKVAQEVKEATKMSEIDNFAEFAASMNEETLGKMQNLHAAITETIRLYPPTSSGKEKIDYMHQHVTNFLLGNPCWLAGEG